MIKEVNDKLFEEKKINSELKNKSHKNQNEIENITFINNNLAKERDILKEEIKTKYESNQRYNESIRSLKNEI